MQRWPASAVLCLMVALIAGAVATQQMYVRTKAAWFAAGTNEGNIEARIEMMQRLRLSGLVSKCMSVERDARRELVSVKAEAIFLIGNENEPRLCE